MAAKMKQNPISCLKYVIGHDVKKYTLVPKVVVM